MTWPIKDTSHEVHVPMSIAYGMCQNSVDQHVARIAELEAVDEWQPISSLPRSGQALVTDDDPGDGSEGYGTIGLVVCPMLEDGRLLNQNSGNYSRPGTWTWWRPVPVRRFKSA